MTLYDVAGILADRIATLAQYRLYRDGDVPHDHDPPGPYIVMHAGAGDPTSRDMALHPKRVTTVTRFLCVNDTAPGAVWVAHEVLSALDGLTIGADYVLCSTGPTLSDPDMETGLRWSVTVEATYACAPNTPAPADGAPFADSIP